MAQSTNDLVVTSGGGGPPISLIGLYNAIYGIQGEFFPNHLLPVAAALLDERIQKLLIIIGPGSGKSRLLLCAYPAWKIGCDPSESILGVSAAEGLPQSFMKSVMEIIEHSPYFRKSFPGIGPNKSLGWSTKTGIYVTSKPVGDSKPSYICAGLDSQVLTGLHARTLIFDDLHDKDNVSTPENAKKVIDTYYTTLIHRTVPEGSRYICAGRRWAEYDILGHFMEQADWVALTLPAERAGQHDLFYDVIVPADLQCFFTEEGNAQETELPESLVGRPLRAFRAYYGRDPAGEGFYWPEHKQKRKEWLTTKAGSPDIAEAVYQCNPGQRSGSIFRAQDFSYFSLPNAEIVSPLTLPAQFKEYKVIQSWDTALSVSKDSAFSACITGILVPCGRWHRGEDSSVLGECDAHFDLYIIDAFKDRLVVNELMGEMRRKWMFWRASEVLIEEKSSGIPALQTLPTVGVPVVPMKSFGTKLVRATSSIDGGTGTVQGWFRLGRVHFHDQGPWLKSLERELKNFSGDGFGYKDQVDALVYLVQRAIKLSAGRLVVPDEAPVTTSSIRENIDPSIYYTDNFFKQIESANNEIDHPQDPMPFCYNCRHLNKLHFCNLQNRKVAALDSCLDWSLKEGKDPRLPGIIFPSTFTNGMV